MQVLQPGGIPVSRLTCGFCGFVSPRLTYREEPWAPYYRAVYCTGPDLAQTPRLSGVGYHRHDSAENYVPPRAHQRYDDPGLDPATLVNIRAIQPPGPEVPVEDWADYSWGFLFHEACWGLLEQASEPDLVSVEALWRILLSVPCGSELPNWGHNYGGLFVGTTKDLSKGEHFVLMGPNSNLVIPSTFSNPFKVPEMEKLVASLRIRPGECSRVGPGHSTAAIRAEAASPCREPFGRLPPELKELLLCYLESPAAAKLRLASREIASVPLGQQFFRSRFWPDREMHVFFDAFLLPPSDMRSTHWQGLFWQLKTKLKYNKVGLGERNRIRIWNQTIKPLADATSLVVRMSELQGDHYWDYVDDEDLGSGWKIVQTARFRQPAAFGEFGRPMHKAEVELPEEAAREVHVSLMPFFGLNYVTGLRFVFDESPEVELGYILRGYEARLPVEGYLAGFHAAVDECGIRALALIMGRHMMSEYLDWAGQVGSLPYVPIKSLGQGLRRLRAAFDVSAILEHGLPEDTR